MSNVTSDPAGTMPRSDFKLYAAFGAAGVVIGLLFPPVASFFVDWKPGMLGWFVAICIAAGEVMAMVAAVAVRSTIVADLLEKERVEREKRGNLLQALHAYASFAEQVGQGKLSARLGDLSGRYQDPDVLRLGRQLDVMASSLHELSKQIAAATEQTNHASAQLLTSSAQQSTGTAEQASAVSEITTTVEEVRQTAEQAAERAQAVIGTTEQAQRSYESGLAALRSTIASITTLKERVDSIARSILDLSDKTQQIGEIVATVSELAEQSNLLAINAAIEAAKAGEQGRGFAVVATEVRNLAEQSKQATRQVRSIIAEIQRATNSAVMVTEDGSKQADAGVKVANETGATLQLLTRIIEDAVQSARQIAALSRQQALGVDQVSISMRNIQATMKDSVEATQSNERAARQMSELATQMKELVARHTI